MKNINEIDEIYTYIDELLIKKGRIYIAIDGMSCSGKSTLAGIISEKYKAEIIHMDDFFLPPIMRTEARLNEPGGNFDRERFLEEVINKLGEPFSYGKFNCKKMKIDTEVFIGLSEITIIEGSYALHPDIDKKYDLKICTKVSREEQIKRLKSRENPQLFDKFINIWMPMEYKYHAFYNIYENCDLIYHG